MRFQVKSPLAVTARRQVALHSSQSNTVNNFFAAVRSNECTRKAGCPATALGPVIQESQSFMGGL